MNVIKVLSRKEFIEKYLQREEEKGHDIPDLSGVKWNDVNYLDSWLASNGYKLGIISGFKQWALVKMKRNDLEKCAVVNSIFPGSSQNLKNLLNHGILNKWSPDKKTTWYDHLSSGKSFKEQWAIVLRPALPQEESSWYVEDGSGRALCALKFGLEEIYAYLGFSPDENSGWLVHHLNGYFVSNNNFENLSQVISL